MKKLSISKINFLIILPTSLFFLYMYINKTILSETLVWTWWSYSEWLINYPDMFVRRGLAGEIIISLSDGASNFNSVQALVFINFTLFSFLLLLTFIKYKLDLTKFLILAISPLGIYSFIIYDTIYHRKEIFILNLLLIYVLINEQKKSFLFNSVYIYFFTLISLLVHEGVSLILLPFLFYIYKNEILYYRMPVNFFIIIFYLL